MPPVVRWITDFETAEAILRHKEFREVTFKGLVPLLGHVIVTMEGQAHRERRTLAGPLFLPAVLKAVEHSVVGPIIGQTLDGIGPQANLVKISYEVTARLAGQVIGLDDLTQPERTSRLVELLAALVSGTRKGVGLTRRAARDELRHSFIDAAISRRRNLLALWQVGRVSSEELPTDLITLLLLHNIQAGTKWDTRQIAGEAAFYSVAAVDTTASLIPHLLHELWQFTTRFPQYAGQLHDPTFLRTATAEALRLHPAIPTIFREATNSVSLNDKLQFEPSQVAGLYVSQANRDPAIFGPDAEDFNPLRQLSSKIRRAGLSFGGGSHLCLGRELATGTPELDSTAPLQLSGQTALIAQALLQRGARPDPSQPVAPLSPFARDTYLNYPILLDR